MRMVEGVDEGQPAFLFELPRMRRGIVEFLAEQHDLCPVARGLRYLHLRRRLRHHDRHRNAEPLAVIGEALRMIARRRGDHAARFRFVVEEEERRSEEHTSELQSLMRTSYAVFCLQKKTHKPSLIAH